MLDQLLIATQAPAPPTHSPVKPGPPSPHPASQNQQLPNPKQQVYFIVRAHTPDVYICIIVYHSVMCVIDIPLYLIHSKQTNFCVKNIPYGRLPICTSYISKLCCLS